jgi:competence protein ComEA
MIIEISGEAPQPGIFSIPANITTWPEILTFTGNKPRSQRLPNILPRPASGLTVEFQDRSAADQIKIRNMPYPTAALFFLPLDINQARPEDFQTLPGIGPKIAARIVAFRQEHSFFQRIEDLTKVKGIGPKKFARVAPQICVNKLE